MANVFIVTTRGHLLGTQHLDFFKINTGCYLNGWGGDCVFPALPLRLLQLENALYTLKKYKMFCEWQKYQVATPTVICSFHRDLSGMSNAYLLDQCKYAM